LAKAKYTEWRNLPVLELLKPPENDLVFRGTVEPTARTAVGFLFTYSAPEHVFLEMPRSSDCCHTG
jgi:hypothetical protein